MRGVLVVVLVVACLAVGTWRALADDPVAPPLAIANSAPSPAAGVDRAPPATAPAAPRDAALREAAAPSRGAERWCEVLVVRAASSQPVAGAEVLHWPPGLAFASLADSLRELAGRDRDAFLRRVGEPLVTDAHGRCRVPIGDRVAQVIATHDGERAVGSLDPAATSPVVLRLVRDVALRVQVVDADGAPVPRVQVAASRRGEPATEHGLGVTDADGRCVREHAQDLAGGASTTLEVFARYAGGATPSVVVDPAAPPPEVVLRLPRTGRVTVRVLDAHGAAIEPALLAHAAVELAAWPGGTTDERAERGAAVRPLSAPIDANGEAVFGAVAFGCTVRAAFGHRSRQPVVAGPTPAQPIVALELREHADDVVLVGTLFGVDAAPYRGAPFLVACHRAGAMTAEHAGTAHDGRFRVCLAPHGAGPRSVVSFDTQLGGAGRALAIELPPRDLAPGVNELGEVRLERQRVLVDGVVVGDDVREGGRPSLQLQFERQRDGRWQREPNLRPTWDGLAFRVRSGIPTGAPMRLVVQGTAFLPVAPIEFAAGARIEVPLRSGGAVTATVRTELREVPVRWLRLLRTATGGRSAFLVSTPSEGLLETRPAVDGRVLRTWSGLEPGRYRLEVRPDDGAVPMVAIDDLEVTDGPCRDPRLDVDLRGLARTIAVRVTAPGGPIARRDAFVAARGADVWTACHLGRGVVELPVAGAIDLVIVVPGHRSVWLDGVATSCTIALDAAPSTTLALALPGALPDGALLHVRLEPELPVPARKLRLDSGAGTARELFAVELTAGADGRADVAVQHAGVHALTATLRRGTRSAGLVPPRAVTLPAIGELVVPVDPAAWLRAVRHLDD